ncbi:MAG TPA: hypothetical protein VMV46_06210 [Thermoanaerobaculia bacterium]|nr:hypothetical protein [Thermoanaerobaculia bacterium]
MKNARDAETHAPAADPPQVLDEDAIETISGGSLRTTEDREREKAKETIEIQSFSW